MNNSAHLQDKTSPDGFLYIPSSLNYFENKETELLESETTDRLCYFFKGYMKEREGERVCPKCGNIGHLHGDESCMLRHMCFGYNYSRVYVKRSRFKCPKCSHTYHQKMDFKADGHFITKDLELHILKLLESGLTIKACAEICSVSRRTVKEIDLKRLSAKYLSHGSFIKPEHSQGSL